MSESAAPSEPTPFERMKALAKQLVAVPKSEADRREEEWQRQRAEVTARKTPEAPR